MHSKLIPVLLAFLLAAGLTACSHKEQSTDSVKGTGSSETETSVNSTSSDSDSRSSGAASTESAKTENSGTGSSIQAQTPEDPLTAEQLNINYFEWNVQEKIVEDAISYILTLRNQSPYPVLYTEIRYKVSESASDKSLALFDNFKKKHKKYINQEESSRSIILLGTSEAYVKTGQYLTDVPVTIGIHSMTWYDAPNYDQFILMQADTLSLGLVKDNFLYQCHYSFTEKSWTVDSSPAALNTWPDTGLSKLISKPSCDYCKVLTGNRNDYLHFIAYGFSKDEYNAYVQSVMDAGFTRKTRKGTGYYSAEDKKGNVIDLMYNQKNRNIDVSINL